MISACTYVRLDKSENLVQWTTLPWHLQGIFLWEHRQQPHSRRIILTYLGE
jgi:thiamine phosphate synthase YjbQ (UPF0047 family)